MGFPADITRPDIGPGPAFIVAGAGRLAKLIAFAAFQLKILVVAAGAIDGGFNGPWGGSVEPAYKEYAF